MKLTDGLFHKVFDEVAANYPDIENEHWIVDIGAAKMADTPENFDVIVMPNLYGDILSDVAAQIAGSVGLAGSANIGQDYAMFEAIHGSAPRRAGQNLANPSGLMLAAVQMLVHIGQPDAAERMHNAWLKTIEDGVHTYDIFVEGVSTQKVGTREFAAAIVARMGQKPEKLKAASYHGAKGPFKVPSFTRGAQEKQEFVGADVFPNYIEGKPSDLAEIIKNCGAPKMKLVMISSRGTKIWPGGVEDGFFVDNFRCRFMTESGTVTNDDVVALLQNMVKTGIGFIKVESLSTFDGVPFFALGQGQ